MATAYNLEPAYAEVHARIDQLDRDFGRLSIDELCQRTDALRSFAKSSGYGAVADLSGGLRDELARIGRAAIIRPYLDGMRDAAEGDPDDRRATAVYLAAVGARLG